MRRFFLSILIVFSNFFIMHCGIFEDDSDDPLAFFALLLAAFFFVINQDRFLCQGFYPEIFAGHQLADWFPSGKLARWSPFQPVHQVYLL